MSSQTIHVFPGHSAKTYRPRNGIWDCLSGYLPTTRKPNYTEALYKAFDARELDTILDLLETKSRELDLKTPHKVKVTNAEGRCEIDLYYPAFLAVMCCTNPSVLNKFLTHFKEQIDLNYQTKLGKLFPLFFAMAKQKWDFVECILDYKDKYPENVDRVKLNLQAENGCTPLHLACYFGKLEIVKRLLRYPDIILNLTSTEKEGRSTPLHYAAIENHPLVVKYLIEDARVNIFAGCRRGSIFKIAYDKNKECDPCEMETMLDKFFMDNYSVDSSLPPIVFEQSEIPIPTLPSEFKFFNDILKQIPILKKLVFQKYVYNDEDKKNKVYIAHFIEDKIFIEIYDADFYIEYLKSNFFPKSVLSNMPISNVLEFSDPNFKNFAYILNSETAENLIHLLITK